MLQQSFSLGRKRLNRGYCLQERVRQKLKQFYAMRRAAVDQLVQTESLATLKAADAAFEAFQDLPPQTPLAELATPADGGEADGGLIAPLRLLQPSSVEHLTEIGLLARIRRVVSSAVGTLERQNARQVKQNEAKLRRAAARTAKKLAAQEARQLEKAQVSGPFSLLAESSDVRQGFCGT